MSENKKKPQGKKPVEKKQPVAKANSAAKGNNQKNAPAEGEKKKLSRNTLAIIISVSVLLVIAITVGVVLLVDYIKNDRGFDYMKSDLSKYIEIDGSYKDIEVSLDIAKPRPVDTDNAILAILAGNRDKSPINGSDVRSYDPTVIGPGDVLYVWYRGYYLDSNGEKVYPSDLTNFTSSSSGKIVVGQGGFYPGVELDMVGKNTGDYAKFEKITSGRVDSLEGDVVVYVSYTRKVSNNDNTNIKEEKATAERIVLSDDVDAVYGDQFKMLLRKAVIGESKWDLNNSCGDVNYAYTDIKISFATTCEGNPLVLSGYVPYDVNKTYRNQDVYFEMYFDGIIDYNAPEFTDEFIQSKFDDESFDITREELEEYEGNTLTEKYYKYVEEVVYDIYESDYESYLEEAIWTKYLAMTTVKKYPKQHLQAVYDDYVREVNYKYAENGGVIYYEDGTSKTYTNIDDYANAYYNCSQYNITWTDYCYLLSQNKIKERLLMFYLMRENDLVPSDSEFDETYNSTVNRFLNDYVTECLNYDGIDKSTMTDAEYEKFVNTCRNELFIIISEEEFKETAYYLLLIEHIKDWPGIKVTTLDDTSALPQDK